MSNQKQPPVQQEEKTQGYEQYASAWVLRLAGSLLVLSIALNNIGFRLDKVLDAYSIMLVEQAKASAKTCPVVPVVTDVPHAIEDHVLSLDARVSMLEEIAHPPGKKN